MTAIENGNQAAYPSEVADNETDTRRGLTKREAIAKDLMAGLISNPAITESHGFERDGCAAEARKMADALLAELERTRKP